MARRRREEHMVRSLNKTSGGKSYSVTFPIDVICRFRWQKRQELSLTVDNHKRRVIIEDWQR